jgi:hypothetical protein
LFNYPGQSHTIYDKNLNFTTADFSSILDQLIYRLSSEPNQLNIMGKQDRIKLIGFGYGGYLAASFISSSFMISAMVSAVILVNTPWTITKKYKEIYTSLLEVYSVEERTTEENAFLFYNKAINSVEIEK